MLSLSYTSGSFHFRTWLVYSNDGLPQIALGLHEQASWMHTHLVLFLSFHKLIALVHPLHGNPYSLTLISIDGHLHSLLIRLVDVRLSPSFCLLHNHLYSTYSAMSMAHAHVLRESWKGLRMSKVWNNCLACHRGCAWFEYFVWRRWCIAKTIWFCRDKLSLAMLFWEDIIILLVWLKYYCFYVNIKLLFWIIRIWTFMPQ